MGTRRLAAAAIPPLKDARLGGALYLEQLLGFSQTLAFRRDVVFVSLDLELTASRRTLNLSSEKPVVTQLGFARLDTRDINSLSLESDLRSLVSVSMFKDDTLPTSRRTRQQCIFAQAQSVSQHEVPATISRYLRIRDDTKKPETGKLRNIVLVGHSIEEDVKILHSLGIQVSDISPITAMLDTHTMSRCLLAPYDPDLRKSPGQDFSLKGVLAQLGYHPYGFHNAGNDATYALYAMLLLVMRQRAFRTAGMGKQEFKRLKVMNHLVNKVVERDFLRPDHMNTVQRDFPQNSLRAVERDLRHNSWAEWHDHW